MDRLVTIRSCRYGIDIQLSPDAEFGVLAETLAEKFHASAGFFKNAQMALSFSGRILSRTEEEHVLKKEPGDNTDINILCIISRDEKMEAMYRSVVEQTLSDIQKREGLFSEEHLQKDRFWSLMPALLFSEMWNREPE